jgi:hypothetical protein
MGRAGWRLPLLRRWQTANPLAPLGWPQPQNSPSPDRKNREAQTIGWQMMTERITHSSVTFLQAFVLREVEGVQSPGTYLIETVEEPLGNLSFLAYRRVSTTITLPAVGAASLRKQVVTIDPNELHDALAKDASATTGDGGARRT